MSNTSNLTFMDVMRAPENKPAAMPAMRGDPDTAAKAWQDAISGKSVDPASTVKAAESWFKGQAVLAAAEQVQLAEFVEQSRLASLRREHQAKVDALGGSAPQEG